MKMCQVVNKMAIILYCDCKPAKDNPISKTFPTSFIKYIIHSLKFHDAFLYNSTNCRCLERGTSEEYRLEDRFKEVKP